MISRPFEASRLKIARAAEHASSLEREIESYLTRNPVHMNVTRNVNADYLDWVQVCTEGIPVKLAPIIGDIVHNLRTSLDLLACELVRLNGGSDKDVYFPFCKNASDLEKMIKKKNFNKASPEAIDLVRSLKPYIGGNIDMRYVHDLDILDKHIMLIPSAGYLKNPGGGMGFDQENLSPRTLGSGTILASLTPNLVPDNKLPVELELIFPWRGPFEDRQIIPTFHGLVEEFSGIVDLFETRCFAKELGSDSNQSRSLQIE